MNIPACGERERERERERLQDKRVAQAADTAPVYTSYVQFIYISAIHFHIFSRTQYFALDTWWQRHSSCRRLSVVQPFRACDVIIVADNLSAAFEDRTVYWVKRIRLEMTYLLFSLSISCFIVTAYAYSVSALEVPFRLTVLYKLCLLQ